MTKFLSIDITPNQEALVQKAARLSGLTHEEFVLNSACKEAENLICDQTHFYLDEEKYRSFVEALNENNKSSALKHLLSKPAPWES